MKKASRPGDQPPPALPQDRDPCSCARVRRAARALTQLYDDALAPTGLRITQYSLLATVDRHGSIPMTALAGVLAMDRTTLTRNLTPLQRGGLVSLRAAGRGRTKLVRLTERGRALVLEAYPYWQEAQRRFASDFGRDRARELNDLTAAVSP